MAIKAFYNTIPLREYLAGSHHLINVTEVFTKDQPGLRQKDIDHKDKQNFDAVTRITNPSVLGLLKNISDAKGTLIYLKLLKNYGCFFRQIFSTIRKDQKGMVCHFLFMVLAQIAVLAKAVYCAR